MARRVRVLYHYPCIDGVCAALATHLAFRDKPDVGMGADGEQALVDSLFRHPLRAALELQAARMGEHRPRQ